MIKFIKINGLKTKLLEYKKQNFHHNILILHGWGGKSDSWLNVGQKLEKEGYNVYIPDLPGFGETILDKVYNLDDYVEFIGNLIKYLKIQDNLIILGHSNGGAISIKLLDSGIIKPIRLILNNSAGIRNTKKISIKRKVFKIFVFLLKPFSFIPGFNKIRNIFYRAIGSHDYLNAEKNKFLLETYKNIIGEDLSEIIPKIKTHTLLIRGEKDNYTPLWMGNKMRGMIKKSKLITLRDQTHGIHLKNPDLLVETILDNI